MIKKIFLFLIPFIIVSCKTIEKVVEVPVEVIKTEHENIYHYDSIFQKEYVNVYVKGDTVFKDSTVTIYKEKQVHDTLITHDTIPRVVPIEKIVEKKVPQWWPVWLMIGITTACGIFCLFKKFNILKHE